MRVIGRCLATAIATVAMSVTAWAKPVELVVQYTQPQIFDGVFEKLKAEFETQNPDIKIKFRAPLPNYGEGVQSLLREATVGDMPHVDYLGLSHLPTVVARGLAVDLAPLMKADGQTFDENGWTESLQGLGQVNGTQYGLPFAVSMSLTYFNADLVRKVGGDPKNMPTDWDGILALAGKIKALGSDYAGMYIPYSSGWYGAWYFQGVLYSHGGEMMNPDANKVSLADDPAWQKTMNLYDRMAKEGGMLAIGDQAQRQQFISGKMGFVIDSISRLKNFETAIGDRFDFQTAPHPMATSSGQLPTGGNLALITTAATSDPGVLEAAWKWVKFSTGPFGTTQVVKQVGYTPVNVKALEDPAYLKGYFTTRPRHKTAVDQISKVREWYQYPGEHSLKINDVIGEHLEGVVDKSMTPAEALSSLTTEINHLLP